MLLLKSMWPYDSMTAPYLVAVGVSGFSMRVSHSTSDLLAVQSRSLLICELSTLNCRPPRTRIFVEAADKMLSESKGG